MLEPFKRFEDHFFPFFQAFLGKFAEKQCGVSQGGGAFGCSNHIRYQVLIESVLTAQGRDVTEERFP